MGLHTAMSLPQPPLTVLHHCQAADGGCKPLHASADHCCTRSASAATAAATASLVLAGNTHTPKICTRVHSSCPMVLAKTEPAYIWLAQQPAGVQEHSGNSLLNPPRTSRLRRHRHTPQALHQPAATYTAPTSIAAAAAPVHGMNKTQDSCSVATCAFSHNHAHIGTRSTYYREKVVLPG
eukprot:GHRQ01025858.1.p1 GENE.GHRQ01025858.1~~GHRQ01025858.1.p1  ORF type:complete len:180 (-),score=49.62 GHRQ01025858.1:936-1475(-)